MSVPDQAAEWLLRWHVGELSIAERFEYLQWLKTSPMHIAETLRVCRLYSWLETTKLTLYLTNEDSFANVVELPPREMERADAFEAELVRAARAYPVDTDTIVRNAHAALARKRRLHVRIAAASVAMAAVAALWLLRALWTVHEIQTGAGEWMTLTLEDSTEVRLGPNSQVRFEYDDDRRTVIVESGRALFEVSKDRRPFLVRVHQIDAQALGTTFAVSLRSDEAVTVTVQEGRVAVSPRDSPVEMLYLSAGEQVEVAGVWPVIPRHIDDVASELAWAHKRLSFRSGDTLASAVAEFNRLNAIQIRIDQQLASRPIRGEFDASDPVSFAHAVGKHAGNIVLSRTADTVRLEVKEQSPGEQNRGARDDR